MIKCLSQGSLVQLKLPLVVVNLVVGVVLLAPGDCHAQQLPRSPAIEEVVIDNGCRVLFQLNNSAPTVAISALVKVRASQETRLTVRDEQQFTCNRTIRETRGSTTACAVIRSR